jgi:hypothetical protein
MSHLEGCLGGALQDFRIELRAGTRPASIDSEVHPRKATSSRRLVRQEDPSVVTKGCSGTRAPSAPHAAHSQVIAIGKPP